LKPSQTAISVKVKHPEIEHTVRVQNFERWLEATLRSPAEMILKNRLRELLARIRELALSTHAKVRCIFSNFLDE